MKKVFIFCLVILSIIFVSCTEKEKEKYDKGTIVCVNTSSDTYFVSIDGPTSKSFTLFARNSERVPAKIGSYKIHYTQTTGYILYPTEGTINVTVIAGNDVTAKLPK